MEILEFVYSKVVFWRDRERWVDMLYSNEVFVLEEVVLVFNELFLFFLSNGLLYSG